MVLSAFQNAHNWAPPKPIEPTPLGREWSETFHPWFSLGPEPDGIRQAETGQEGVRLQEGLELNISLRNPSPPKLSKPLVTEFPKGREESVLCKFSSVYQRESCRTFYDRNFQEFPDNSGLFCHNQILTLQEALLGAGAVGKMRHDPGTSLGVQGLRLCAPNAGDLWFDPSLGTGSHMLQLKILHATMKTDDPMCCN